MFITHHVYTMREKIEMVIGGAVPSWQKSIPGPQYRHAPIQLVTKLTNLRNSRIYENPEKNENGKKCGNLKLKLFKFILAYFGPIWDCIPAENNKNV